MFVRIGKFLVVVTLVAMLGAHWTLLQTVAWTTMLAQNLQSSSFHVAMEKTFDGAHPCPLCKAIAAGKKSEQKTEFTLQLQKLEFPLTVEKIILFPPSQFEILSPQNSSADYFGQKPPVPPPRAV